MTQRIKDITIKLDITQEQSFSLFAELADGWRATHNVLRVGDFHVGGCDFDMPCHVYNVGTSAVIASYQGYTNPQQLKLRIGGSNPEEVEEIAKVAVEHMEREYSGELAAH